MNHIEKKSLLQAMENYMAALQQRTDRDFGGGLSGDVEAYRAVKFFKESVERGDHDVRIWTED
ncbi:hypothetical protein [Bacillus sp. T33-2]|uniref:hypothetical protein n=1 Tax=Bacillus sp. T33-2 TaxID=2054168 RepID=UPI000C786CF0|nr:hypothetical protein [Bacillus sp. T33-2]PLR99557.1 hypothetical protein CVD19_00405 [Bacillus sp. T33-2]